MRARMKKLDPPVKSVILSNCPISLNLSLTHDPTLKLWTRITTSTGTYLQSPGDKEARELPGDSDEQGDDEVVLVDNDVGCHRCPCAILKWWWDRRPVRGWQPPSIYTCNLLLGLQSWCQEIGRRGPRQQCRQKNGERCPNTEAADDSFILQ